MSEVVLKAEIQQLQIEIDLLRRRYEDQTIRLQRELDHANSELGDLKRAGIARDRDTALREATAELEELRERTKDSEARVQTLMKSLGTLQIEKAELAAEVEGFRRAGGVRSPGSTATEAQLAAETERRIALEVEIEELRQEREASEAAIIDLEEIRQDRDALRAKCSDLTAEIERLRGTPSRKNGGKRRN